jgi:DNA-directed RNA polymerase subunit F
MVVEAKRRLDTEKIREFVEKLSSIPEYMPEYAGHKLVPVVASVTIDPSAITFLNRQKVYGVAMGDETMQLVNLGQF